jgi:lysophospholipase L1-like esterase
MPRRLIIAFTLIVSTLWGSVDSSRSFDVPEGSYRVTITFGSETEASETTVFAESRQLLLEKVRTEPGEFVVRQIHVNTRTPQVTPPPLFAPGADTVILNDREIGIARWDQKLTLDFMGSAPAVSDVQIEPAPEVPVIYLLGDSTVTDQSISDQASWGQMLPRFFDGSVAIANHAESGETLKSFIFTNRLNKVLATLSPRDTVFIQFGHNDQKPHWPQTYVEPHTTWPAYLRVYLAEIRLRGATPVLVTSMERRKFSADGRIISTHGDYPQVVRDLAAEEGVALIDLQPISVALYEALGPERAPLAFAKGGEDGTHHNTYGAYQLALAVAHGMKAAAVPVAEHLIEELPHFDPSQPSPPEEFGLSLPGNTSNAPSPDRGP